FIGRLALSLNEQVFWKWLDPKIRSGLDPKGADLEEALASKADLDYWMPLMMRNFAATLGAVKRAGVPLVVLARASLVSGTAQMAWQAITGSSAIPATQCARLAAERIASLPA